MLVKDSRGAWYGNHKIELWREWPRFMARVDSVYHTETSSSNILHDHFSSTPYFMNECVTLGRSYHYRDVIMIVVASQITCVSIVFSTVSSAPRHWSLYGEFTGRRWIPRTKDQWRGKCFHLMTSSWYLENVHRTTSWWRRLGNAVAQSWRMRFEMHFEKPRSAGQNIISSRND